MTPGEREREGEFKTSDGARKYRVKNSRPSRLSLAINLISSLFRNSKTIAGRIVDEDQRTRVRCENKPGALLINMTDRG